MNQIWVCGKYKSGLFPNVSWDIQGVFANKEKAIKACRDETYFIAPLELDKELPYGTHRWPGIIYPLEGK